MRRFHSLESRRIRNRRKKLAYAWDIGFLTPDQALHRAYRLMLLEIDGIEKNKFTVGYHFNYDREMLLGNCGNKGCQCCEAQRSYKRNMKRKTRHDSKVELRKAFHEEEW